MSKKQRLEKISELIENFEIDTQEELTERLNNAGFSVSQATVSRDMKDLNVIKSAGTQKKFKYVKAPTAESGVSDKILNIYKHVTLSITSANNLIVIKTLSGNANTVGMTVDQMNLPQVLGTVAGDDTLLVVTKSSADAEIVVKTLRSI